MSYQAQWLLTYDDPFVSRCRACLTEQSDNFMNDTRGDIAALGRAMLTGSNPSAQVTFQTMLATAPGFADMADNGDGTVDSTKIGDPDILAAVQAGYPTVAALYYDPTGAPIP